jgi:hypothetical protein
LAYGVFVFHNQNKLPCLTVNRIQKQGSYLARFFNAREAYSYIDQLVEQYGLIPKLCGIHSREELRLSEEEHQLHFTQMLKEQKDLDRSQLLVFEGRNSAEKAFVWIEGQTAKGYGFCDPAALSDTEKLAEIMQALSDSPIIKGIIKKCLMDDQIERRFIQMKAFHSSQALSLF